MLSTQDNTYTPGKIRACCPRKFGGTTRIPLALSSAAKRVKFSYKCVTAPRHVSRRILSSESDDASREVLLNYS